MNARLTKDAAISSIESFAARLGRHACVHTHTGACKITNLAARAVLYGATADECKAASERGWLRHAENQ